MAQDADKLSLRDLAAIRHRALLRAQVEICAALRKTGASLASAAANAAALRLGEEAGAELAQIPDTPDLRRSDAERLDAAEGPDGFETRIEHLVEAYRNGRALDLFTASPIELLACCVARAGAG